MDLSPVKKLSNRDNFFFVIDASQAVPHFRVDVQQLDADFLYFTGHKLGALTGIGVLYGREALLQELLPGLSGGGAIQEVTTA
jgi:selenocysteine lyase/cysteine desulfurase